MTLDEAIADALNKYPDFDAINDLPQVEAAIYEIEVAANEIDDRINKI